MEIKTFTVELTANDMFELGYALEKSIESDLSLSTEPNTDEHFNDFESELELLQTFVNNGQTLTVSKKTDTGSIWESNPKKYGYATDWFKALLKQRRKEFKAKK